MTEPKQTKGARRPSDKELLEAAPATVGGREARLGLFVIIGVFSFIALLYMMTSPSTFRGRYDLVTLVDNAGGIRKGDAIQMQGVNVGRVTDFELFGPDEVFITMEIHDGWQVPRGSTARLGEAGLFGGRTLEILQARNSEMYAPGDTLPGEGASGGMLSSVDDIADQAADLMTRIEDLLSQETVDGVRGSAQELEGLLAELSGMVNEQRSTMTDLTASLRRAAEGVETATAAGPDVARAVARADSAMANLNATSETLDGTLTTMRTILGRIEAGEGTLGKLSTDDELYVSLTNAANQFQSLLADLEANPKKYINISIF